MAVPNLVFWCEFFFWERRHHKDLEDWSKKPLVSLAQDQPGQCLYINPQSCAINFNDGHLRLPDPKCHPGPQP